MMHGTLPTTPWLLPEEHEYVVATMVRYGLLKFDNNRALPLKSGGETDIYINLRDARNNPEAITFVSELYALALNRLDLDCFVEIPDAVSCFAGPIAELTDLPYLTIRETPKEGRATNSRVIGTQKSCSRTVIIDDVITDGASKIAPIRECQKMLLDLLGLVVLVDRQQGWDDYLARRGILTSVWAGMTLHDVRRALVSLGYMERCDPAREESNPLIIALDGKSWEEHLPFLDAIRTFGCTSRSTISRSLAVSSGSCRISRPTAG